MDVIALAPAFLAALVCLVASPARAFLLVYLPVLLLVPSELRWQLYGLPDVAFEDAAMAPVALAVGLTCAWRWRPSVTDALVAGFVLLQVASEWRAGGATAVQDNLFSWTCGLLFPYLVARWLFTSAELRLAAARTTVALLALVAVLSLWEFRMGSNPLFGDAWRGLFGDQLDQFGPRNAFRFGFARIRGPFPHAILAGMLFGAGLVLQLALHRARAWRNRGVSLLLLAALAGGMAMTLSRGPWLALAASLAVLVVHPLRRRPRLLAGALVTAALVGGLVLVAMDRYATSGGGAADTLQRTVSYRRQLLDLYVPLALERPLLGWGNLGWEAVRGMESVDNQYLLLSLNNGLLAAGTFVALLLGTAARLLRLALRTTPTSAAASPTDRALVALPRDGAWRAGGAALAERSTSRAGLVPLGDAPGASRRVFLPADAAALAPTHPSDDGADDGALACVLLAVIVGIAASIATAWLGGQTQPLLFLVLGASEALLQRDRRPATAGARVDRRAFHGLPAVGGTS